MAETVAAGADEFARLVGTLHSFTPRRARSSWSCACARSVPGRKTTGETPIRGAAEIARAYRETPRASQRVRGFAAMRRGMDGPGGRRNPPRGAHGGCAKPRGPVNWAPRSSAACGGKGLNWQAF
jgi:hypothetical protein